MGETGAGPSVAVLLRHGQREDYIALGEGRGEEWIAAAERPWDPSLALAGIKQANAAAQRIRTELKQAGLPAPSAIFSSPLIRCVQTADILAMDCGIEEIYVEQGLTEAVSEKWYRSFAVPGANSEWNGGAKDEAGQLLPVTPEQVRTEALQGPSVLIRAAGEIQANGGPAAMKVKADHESAVKLSEDLKWGTFESKEAMMERLKTTVHTRTAERPGETCVFVSHGSPTIHGFTALAGHAATGHGGMCAISMLVREGEGWKALIQNDATHADEMHEGPRTGLT